MQELEKILEEIQDHAIEFEVFGTSDDYISVGWVNDIIRRHMKNEEDILKFYYCESEDDYYIGQRVQNMYYARYADGVFTWFMSRHLPWGKRVTAPETAWKEYTYPTEPKEIPFMEWLNGFVRKHMNDGWIPVDKNNVPDHEILACDRYKNELIGYLSYNADSEEFVCESDECIMYQVIAWMEKPEPYRPERRIKNA